MNNTNNIKNLDLVLSKKSLSISEFQKVINDDMVSSVENAESDKKFHLCYVVKLTNSNEYKVYVKMSLIQIYKIIISNKKDRAK